MSKAIISPSLQQSVVEQYNFPTSKGEISFDIKRDDLIDSIISGNKWRKLYYNLLQAVHLKKEGILTFGGAYSNHLIATAKAAYINNLQSIGIVRGDELNSNSNETLSACKRFGMKLVFYSREKYKLRNECDFISKLSSYYPTFYVVPEGGKNGYGVVGCQHIIDETHNQYDHIYLAAGTGTTAAGIILNSNEKSKIHVVSALKGEFLVASIYQLINDILMDKELSMAYKDKYEVITDAHFGGFAKVPSPLIQFINKVYKTIHLKLDPIYTGKAFYRMIQDVENGKIQHNEKVLFIHTGGIQGAQLWKEILNYPL